jgi:hypothetical protein
MYVFHFFVSFFIFFTVLRNESRTMHAQQALYHWATSPVQSCIFQELSNLFSSAVVQLYVPISNIKVLPHLWLHLTWSFFLILSEGVVLTLALICISLVTDDVVHLLCLYLAYLFSLVTCLKISYSFFFFINEFCFLAYWVLRVFLFWIQTFYQIHALSVFSLGQWFIISCTKQCIL